MSARPGEISRKLIRQESITAVEQYYMHSRVVSLQHFVTDDSYCIRDSDSFEPTLTDIDEGLSIMIK